MASKELLHLEQKKPNCSSSLESTLLFCKNGSSSQTPTPNTSSGKLVTTSLPKSQVLGKVKDFLGVMGEANRKLQHDAKGKSSMDYDIEALTGNEKEYIEMDLVLGVADLHTPEAVVAAESAMAGSQPVITLAATCSSGSDTESSVDDEGDDGENNDNDDDDHEDDNNGSKGDANEGACFSNKLKEQTSEKKDKKIILNNGRQKKRQNIIELL